MAQQPLVGQGLLVIEVSPSHSDAILGRTPLDEWFNVSGRIRTRNPSKRVAAADPRLRPPGHWDRHTGSDRVGLLSLYVCISWLVYAFVAETWPRNFTVSWTVFAPSLTYILVDGHQCRFSYTETLFCILQQNHVWPIQHGMSRHRFMQSLSVFLCQTGSGGCRILQNGGQLYQSTWHHLPENITQKYNVLFGCFPCVRNFM
jgi:hypothetical protein